MRSTINNLGRVATILARQEAAEMDMHADVDAFGAPSECHALVAKGEKRRRRLARRFAEATARRPMRIIARELRRRGCGLGSRTWWRLVEACSTFPVP